MCIRDSCETVCQDLLEVLLIWLVRCTTLSLQVEESPRSDNRECVETVSYTHLVTFFHISAP